MHRRVFDDRIDLTFYVDAGNYLPIRFFESWIEFTTNGRNITPGDNTEQLLQPNYFYRMQYPDEYIANQGLKVIKFERDYGRSLQYEFIRAYPLAITSMPVSYEGSNLMTCNVSMTYIRYIASPIHTTGVNVPTPTQQAGFNIGGFLTNAAANLVDSAVTTVTGSDTAGDIAGTVAGVAAANALGIAVVTGTDGVLRNAATGEAI